MKNSIIYIFLMFTAFSCYDDNDFWLDENIKEGGTYFPVIQSLDIAPNSGDVFQSGGTITLSLRYWSRDDVKELQYFQTVDGVETLIDTKPYTNSFDPVSEAQLYDYTTTLPTLDSGASVGYRISVVTVFDVTQDISKSITIK